MIEILQPGAYTTIQGPRAWRQAHFGIPLGGPADERSHAYANRLAGNPPTANALEITLLGPQLRFLAPTNVALFGAPFEANIPLAQPTPVEPGQTILIRGTPQGARCYLAVAGGISAHPGRLLRKGDHLPIGEPNHLPLPTEPPPWPALASPTVLRYTSHEPRPDLAYEVANEANRRGIRLSGCAFQLNHEIITEGVNAGTIQVPPSGQPVILFYDQTTTGGYPKLGTILRADLDKVGQLRPRDQVILRAVPFSTDETAD